MNRPASTLGIPYRDSAGCVLDFHLLRHATGSLLIAAGVHPKTVQAILWHSTITLTMDRYGHGCVVLQRPFARRVSRPVRV